MAHLKNDNDDCLEQQQQQKTTSKPMLRFGVVADVQYADSDDRQAWYNPAKTRFYRNSLKQVEKAFEHWEKVEDTLADEPETCPVSFILQLGDIIDKLNTEACSHTAIDRTLACFLNNPKMPTFHTVGKSVSKWVLLNGLRNEQIITNFFPPKQATTNSTTLTAPP